MKIRADMKECREQIEPSEREAESNSIYVLLYEKEHWHLICLETHQQQKEHRHLICLGTHQQ
jgi:hypothetical protein